MQTGKEVKIPIDIRAIQQVIAHRFPFLLVDRIIEFQSGKRAVGIKNVTINEHFFAGHFPEHPVMPGVLIVEALAQVGGVLLLIDGQQQGKIAYLTAIDNARFRKTVVPGDQLHMVVDVIRLRGRMGFIRGEAFVDDNLVAEADLMFALA
ncbi:MAG: 3-hydroxyacyl-ACP dehydratase FabZ [Chlamydiota bacterium]|nr:3-hydroxyacyl-ACP dehydratase FabZ [Chlamydiota bacterium]